MNPKHAMQNRCFLFCFMFWHCLIDKFQTTTHSKFTDTHKRTYNMKEEKGNKICFDENKLLCKMFYIYSHGFNKKTLFFDSSYCSKKERQCSAMLMSYIKLSQTKVCVCVCLLFFWCSQFFHIHRFPPFVCRMHFSDSFVHVKLTYICMPK